LEKNTQCTTKNRAPFLLWKTEKIIFLPLQPETFFECFFPGSQEKVWLAAKARFGFAALQIFYECTIVWSKRKLSCELSIEGSQFEYFMKRPMQKFRPIEDG
jgi:hypothetical protein